jgi:hypothetical protein
MGMTTFGRRGWPAAVVLVWAAALAGCSAAPPAEPSASAGTPPASAAPSAGATPGGSLSNTAGESPAEVALQLEALLGQHSVLVADMMRSRIRGDDDFAQAASAAVTRNADDLTAVVKAMFGAQAATAFHSTWTDHTAAFYNYARSLATGDTGAREKAQAQLVEFENGLGDFFSAASQGRLPQAAARSTLTTHVNHLNQQADAYAAHDYAKSAELYRTAYTHAFGIGQALAGTLLPPDQAATLQQPSWRLRSELDQLLGEHIALAVATLRSGAMESPDFAAEAASLNKSTDELTAAMGTLFGPAAGQQFMTLWADDIDALAGYTSAVASHNDAGRQAALDTLRGVETQLASFFENATGNRMATADLTTAFQQHDEALTQQVDAAANKDYAKSHDLAYKAYQDMFGLSKQLSAAFGETVAAKLPQGGAETGGGGTAGAAGTR